MFAIGVRRPFQLAITIIIGTELVIVAASPAVTFAQAPIPASYTAASIIGSLGRIADMMLFMGNRVLAWRRSMLFVFMRNVLIIGWWRNMDMLLFDPVRAIQTNAFIATTEFFTYRHR